MPADMRARLGQVELPNPVLAAAGCAGAGRELAQFVDVARVGAIISKSIMTEPRTGNPAPRLAETPSGLLNSIGLQGPGIDAFLQRDLPWLLSHGARVVVSIAGQTVREYDALASRLSDAAGVSAVEINLSCPNAEDAGRLFALDPATAGSVVAAVRGSLRYDIPVFAKLSPDVTDIVAVAGACVAAGADGLSLINVVLGMAIDPRTMRPALAGAYGGLSGPAIRPVAVRCVWQVAEAFPDVPIIGTGGVRTGRDALELLLAGSSMLAVGTAVVHDPSACSRVTRELEEELAALGADQLADVIGRAHGGPGRLARGPANGPRRAEAGLGGPGRQDGYARCHRTRAEGRRSGREQAGAGGCRARCPRPGDGCTVGSACDAPCQHGQGRPGTLPALRAAGGGDGARR